MFGFCPLSTPMFGNSCLHPNVWQGVEAVPRRFYHAELAATWTPWQQLTGRGSHVAAMSAQGKTKKVPLAAKSKEIAAGREDSGGERRREGRAARGSGNEVTNGCSDPSSSFSSSLSLMKSRSAYIIWWSRLSGWVVNADSAATAVAAFLQLSSPWRMWRRSCFNFPTQAPSLKGFPVDWSVM